MWGTTVDNYNGETGIIGDYGGKTGNINQKTDRKILRMEGKEGETKADYRGNGETKLRGNKNNMGMR